MEAPTPDWLRQPTRAKILAAAERHFAADGFERARVDDIAATAGVSKSHLYYHFPAKADLLSCLVEARVGELLAAKDALMAGLDPDRLASDAGALQAVIHRAITDLLLPRRAFVRVVLVEAIRNPDAAAPLFAALGRALDDTLDRLGTRIGPDDRPLLRSLLFYVAIVPALFLVALDADPTGFDGGAAALAGELARIEQGLLTQLGARP